MTIWVGDDGTAVDDQGDGAAAPGSAPADAGADDATQATDDAGTDDGTAADDGAPYTTPSLEGGDDGAVQAQLVAPETVVYEQPSIIQRIWERFFPRRRAAVIEELGVRRPFYGHGRREFYRYPTAMGACPPGFRRDRYGRCVPIGALGAAALPPQTFVIEREILRLHPELLRVYPELRLHPELMFRLHPELRQRYMSEVHARAHGVPGQPPHPAALPSHPMGAPHPSGGVPPSPGYSPAGASAHPSHGAYPGGGAHPGPGAPAGVAAHPGPGPSPTAPPSPGAQPGPGAHPAASAAPAGSSDHPHHHHNGAPAPGAQPPGQPTPPVPPHPSGPAGPAAHAAQGFFAGWDYPFTDYHGMQFMHGAGQYGVYEVLGPEQPFDEPINPYPPTSELEEHPEMAAELEAQADLTAAFEATQPPFFVAQPPEEVEPHLDETIVSGIIAGFDMPLTDVHGNVLVAPHAHHLDYQQPSTLGPPVFTGWTEPFTDLEGHLLMGAGQYGRFLVEDPFDGRNWDDVNMDDIDREDQRMYFFTGQDDGGGGGGGFDFGSALSSLGSAFGGDSGGGGGGGGGGAGGMGGALGSALGSLGSAFGGDGGGGGDLGSAFGAIASSAAKAAIPALAKAGTQALSQAMQQHPSQGPHPSQPAPTPHGAPSGAPSATHPSTAARQAHQQHAPMHPGMGALMHQLYQLGDKYGIPRPTHPHPAQGASS
jgi:hypothetical protein